MTRRRTVGALAAVLALGCASSAPASSIVYVCAPNLCRIDPAHPKQVTRLTRDGKAGGPVDPSPSLSTKGTKLSFVKGNRLYLAQGNATHARRVDEPAGTAVTRMRPDGTQVAYIRSVNTDHLAGLRLPVLLRRRPTAWSPSCSCGRGTADKGRSPWSSGTASTGWLLDRVLFPHPVAGDGVRPDEICIVCAARRERASASARWRPIPVAHALQSRRVAGRAPPGGRWPRRSPTAPPGFAARRSAARSRSSIRRRARSSRDLTTAHADGTPAFSPNGRQVAFTRRENLYRRRDLGRPQAEAPAPRRARSDVGRALAGGRRRDVTWIAWGSRTQAIRCRAVSRSRRN